MIRHACAWEGCKQSTPFDRPLPAGWRWLMLWKDSANPTTTIFEASARADRDACLCPLHANELHNVILKDIGQRMARTEGTA